MNARRWERRALLGAHSGNGASLSGSRLFLTTSPVTRGKTSISFEDASSLDRPIDRVVGEIRERYGVRAIRRGETGDPTGPYTGLKVAFERVPSTEELQLFSRGKPG